MIYIVIVLLVIIIYLSFKLFSFYCGFCGVLYHYTEIKGCEFPTEKEKKDFLDYAIKNVFRIKKQLKQKRNDG